jgi:hypothetical protein
MDSAQYGMFDVGLMIWIGGFVPLFLRVRRKWFTYLQWLEPVDGIPLNMIHNLPGTRFSYPLVKSARWRAQWTKQADPEMERLRRAGWRATILMYVWIFGSPLAIFATFAWITASGALR